MFKMKPAITVVLLALLSTLISASADRLVNVAGNLSVFVDEELPVNVLTDGDSKTCYNVSSDKPLKVDLGEPHRIVAIQVEGDANYQLQVQASVNNSNFNECEEELKERYICSPLNHARHILLKPIENGALCEIQVLECKDGYFGHDCSKTCHCQSEEPCDKETGVCPDRACLPGWKGGNCQEVCTEGSFGSSCGMTCHCKENKTCEVSSGACPNGCAPKWYDPACQTAFPELSEKPTLHDRFPTQLLVSVPTLKTFYNSSTFDLLYKTYIRPHAKGPLFEEEDWTYSGTLEHSKDLEKPVIVINDLHWNTQYDFKIVPVFKRRDPQTREFEVDPLETTRPSTTKNPKSGKYRKVKNNAKKPKGKFKGSTEYGLGDGTESVETVGNNPTAGVNVHRSGISTTGDESKNPSLAGDDVGLDGDADEYRTKEEGNPDEEQTENEEGEETEDDAEDVIEDDADDVDSERDKEEIVGESDSVVYKTSCNKPEAPNVTSVESWVDDRSDIIISVSWTPLSISQSNCDKISVYFVYYKKVGDSQWRHQAADANVTSKNLTGEDIESNSQYVLRVSSQNNMNLQSFSDTWRVKTLEGSFGAESFESDTMSSPGLVAVLIIILISLVITSIVLVIIMNRRRLKMMKGERSVPDSAILLKKSGYSVPMQNGSVVLEEDFEVSVLPWKNQGDQNKKSKAKAKPRVIRPAIKTEELEDYLKERSENNFEELRKEYKEIPEGNAEATTVAGLKMDNRLKNRFINIIPYDHSRVVLDLVEGDSTSDYINANYIDGYNKSKFYIAAQGCNKWSVQDIWRMLWQENSLRIVVLTNLVEKGRPKCEQYWPDQVGEEKSYGDLGVTLTSVESSASHVVRSFTLRKCIETNYGKGENFGKSGGSLKKSKKTSPDKTSVTQLRENSSDVDLKKAEKESLLVKNGDVKENCLVEGPKRNGSIDGQHDRTIYENCKIRSTDAITSSGENIYANVEPNLSRESPNTWIEETREVKQFHFTSWPDHGVPYHTAPLIAFRNKVRKHDSTHPGPIIVHCSAGVGRSGTFIALDYLLEQAEAEKKVDLHGLTHDMRLDRCNMIQTVEQYIFVYEALIEAMKSRSSLISLSDFESRYKELMSPNGDSGKNGLTLQFEQLMEAQAKLLPVANCDARLPLNVCKNRNSNILPDDNHRPYLMTTVEGTNDYINAVFLDSYRRQNSIILTQMPLLNTVIDLWRMVRDHKCSAVVMVNHFDTLDETAAQYWPEENEECECGPFLIETLSTDRSDSDVVTRQLQLNYFPDLPHKEKQSTSTSSPPIEAHPSDDGQPNEGHEQPGEVHHVTHLQLLNWSSQSNLPPSELPIIRLVEKIDEIQKKNPDQPIVVHCMDGASQSGLLVTSVCIWERMKDELEVDVFETTKRLKSIRPQIINNLEQYSFLYKMVLLYLREFATYSNFN